MSILKNYSAGKITLNNAVSLFADIGVDEETARKKLLDYDE